MYLLSEISNSVELWVSDDTEQAMGWPSSIIKNFEVRNDKEKFNIHKI